MIAINQHDYLLAMKADSIPAASSGLWYIHKIILDEPVESDYRGKSVVVPVGTYTFLRCLTESTLHRIPPGEVVMEDTRFELQTHFGFVMQAYGRVLVTGLGLGCVIRGLLKNPSVERVVCIEKSKDVLKLVEPHIQDDRLKIINADALEWSANNKDKFDCAWHDLWTNRDNGEHHLDFLHAKVIAACRHNVTKQGAWGFNKQAKSFLLKNRFQWIG